MSITRISSACAAAGALVLLAGCGSSSSTHDSAAGSTAGSSSTPTASPSPTVTAATVVQLKKIVLQAGDLPSSWKGRPSEQDSGGSDETDLIKCIGAKDTDPDQVATTDSQDFSLEDATVSSSATSYKSQSDLDSDTKLFSSPKLAPCFSQLVKKQFTADAPKGASVGKVSVKFTPGPGSGPANVVGSGAVSILLSLNGQQVPDYINFVFMTGPLIEAEVDAENIGTPVSPAVLQAAVKAVADRAASSS